MHRRLTGFLCVMLGALVTVDADAAGPATCHDYAAAAVKAAEEVRTTGCSVDYGNPAWSTDYNVHRRWCAGVGEDSLAHETNQRNDTLGRCNRCAGYSRTAVNAANKVRDLQCGYKVDNPQWSLKYEEHMRWCMSASSDSVNWEWAGRNSLVDVCGQCRDYANLAAKTVAEFYQYCGLPSKSVRADPNWHPDPQAHFKWCMGGMTLTDHINNFRLDTKGDLDQKTGARLAKVEACKIATTKEPLTVEPARRSAPEIGKQIRRSQDTVRKGKAVGTTNGAARRKTGTSQTNSSASTAKKTGLHDPCKQTVAGQPCRGSRSLLAPGLLDSGPAGFSRQGPAPVGGGGGGSSGGGIGLGDSIR